MAAEKIDMSLDEIIKMDGVKGVKRQGGAARRAGNAATNTSSGNRGNSSGNRNNSNRGGGAIRPKMTRSSNRAAPYSRASRIPDQWQHDMFEGSARGTASGSNHLLVSNLDYGVSDKDVQDLFAEFGALKKAAVHYDRSGRSLGTADVFFEKRGDAAAAMKQYNGVLLDGRPMKITIVPSSTDNQRRAPITQGAGNNFNRPSKFNATRGGGAGQRQNQPQRNRNNNNNNNRGGNRGNQGPRRGNQNRKPVTAEELDADLDAYVNK